MKKSKLILALLTLISLLIVITSAFAADLTVSNQIGNIVTNVNPGSSVTGTFDIKNNDATTSLTNINFILSLTSGSNNIPQSSIIFNPNNFNLVANETKTVTFTINTNQFQLPGTYTGNLAIDYRKDNIAQPRLLNQLAFSLDIISKTELKVDSTITVNARLDATTTKTFTIQNTGNVALTSLNLATPNTITDNDNDVTTVSLDKITINLNPGVIETITISADVSQDMDIRNYVSNLTISNLLVTKTSTLNIDVKPEICSEGPRGSALDIRSVDSPDDSEEFAPGENIPIEVRVDNDGNDNLDVEVEAILYDKEKNRELESERDTKRIRDGEDERFEFDLKVPTDIDESNSRYAVLIKASDDGNEEDECVEKIIDIEIVREDDAVIINRATFTPSIASCGDSVTLIAEVENVGSDDQESVRIELFIDELGISKFSDTFRLNDFDSDDKEALRSITFKIPEDADEKTYQGRVAVTFRGGPEELPISLDVTDCEVTLPTEQLLFNLLQSSYSIKQGDSFRVQVLIQNFEDISKVLTLEAIPSGNWAQTVTQTVALLPNDEKTVSLEIQAPSDAETGTKTLSLNLKSGSQLLDSKTVTVEVGSKSGGTFIPPTTGFTTLFGGKQGTVLFILADIVLVILAIYFLILLFRKKK